MGFVATVKGLFDSLRSKTFQLFGWDSSIGTGGPGNPTQGGGSSYNAGKWLKAFKSCTDLKAPITCLARDVAAVQYGIYRVMGAGEDGQLELRRLWDHPAWRLWKQPNFYHTSRQFLQLGMEWLETTGRWGTFIERGPNGLPAALYPIAPTDIKKMPTAAHPFWVFKLHGRTIKTSPANFIWISYIDVEAPYGWGASPCEAVASEVQQIQYANKWNLNHFRQGAHIGKIIGVPGLTKQTGPSIQADFDARFKGPDNAHKAFFVGTGVDSSGKVNPSISVVDLGKSHKDMDYREMQEFLADKVACNWQVPRSILGKSGNANRSEGDNDIIRYQRQSVCPRAEFVQEQFQLQLIGEWQEPDLWLDFDDPVQASREFALTQASEGLSRGSVTINEWRKSQNMESIGPIGDVLLIPVNLAVAPKSWSADDLYRMISEHNSGNPQPTSLTLSASVGG